MGARPALQRAVAHHIVRPADIFLETNCSRLCEYTEATKARFLARARLVLPSWVPRK